MAAGRSVEKVHKTDKPVRPGPQRVAVLLEPPSILAHLPTRLRALAGVVVVTVLMIFMLLARQKLRDRVIMLIGYAQASAIIVTTCEARG